MDSRYAGMTVNERLHAANLFAEFDAAVRVRNRSELIRILESLELTSTQAAQSADMILERPKSWG
jgi:hypothetical protein